MCGVGVVGGGGACMCGGSSNLMLMYWHIRHWHPLNGTPPSPPAQWRAADPALYADNPASTRWLWNEVARMAASYAQLAPEEDREAWRRLLLAFLKGGRPGED